MTRTLTINGESLHQRCLREAKSAVRARWGSHYTTAAMYGTWQHNLRSRYDREVGEEFVRRLQEAGVYVEGV